MANKERGEVAVQIGKQSFTLCFSTNAIAEIEQVGDASIMVLMAQYVTEGRAATTRLMLWGALRKFHPEISLLEAGDMLDDCTHEESRAIGEATGQALRFRLAALGYIKDDGEAALDG